MASTSIRLQVGLDASGLSSGLKQAGAAASAALSRVVGLRTSKRGKGEDAERYVELQKVQKAIAQQAVKVAAVREASAIKAEAAAKRELEYEQKMLAYQERRASIARRQEFNRQQQANAPIKALGESQARLAQLNRSADARPSTALLATPIAITRSASIFARLNGVLGTATQQVKGFGQSLRSSRPSSPSTGGATNGILGNVGGLQGFAGGFTLLGTASLARSLVDTEKKFQSLERNLQQATGIQNVSAEMDYLTKTSDRLGLSLLDSGKEYAKLTVAGNLVGLSAKENRNVFEGVATASAAMGLSAEDNGGVFRALTQILSKGTVQSEELKGQIGERIPGAFAIMARALKVSTSELTKMLEQGLVPAKEGVMVFAEELKKTFGESAAKGALGMAAAVNRMTTAIDTLKKSLLDGGLGTIFAKIIGDVTSLSSLISSGPLNSALKALADNAKSVSAAILGIGAGLGVSGGIAGLAVVISSLTPVVGALGVAISGLAIPVAGMVSSFIMAKDQAYGLGTVADEVGNRVGAMFEQVKTSLSGLNSIQADFTNLTLSATDTLTAAVTAISDILVSIANSLGSNATSGTQVIIKLLDNLTLLSDTVAVTVTKLTSLLPSSSTDTFAARAFPLPALVAKTVTSLFKDSKDGTPSLGFMDSIQKRIEDRDAARAKQAQDKLEEDRQNKIVVANSQAESDLVQSLKAAFAQVTATENLYKLRQTTGAKLDTFGTPDLTVTQRFAKSIREAFDSISKSFQGLEGDVVSIAQRFVNIVKETEQLQVANAGIQSYLNKLGPALTEAINAIDARRQTSMPTQVQQVTRYGTEAFGILSNNRQTNLDARAELSKAERTSRKEALEAKGRELLELNNERIQKNTEIMTRQAKAAEDLAKSLANNTENGVIP